MVTDYVLPEGNLLRCTQCGQLISQCTEERYWQSMKEFDAPQGTLPNSRSLEKRFRRSKKFLGQIARLLDEAPSNIRLLDVGCSSGAFLSHAVTQGFRAEGVEPAAGPVATAQAAGLTVRQGLLQDMAYADSQFDAVTLFEVIEHLQDPHALLDECRRILRPGGILVIGTGNTASWSMAAMGGEWEYLQIDKHGGHVSFFNPRSIELLARRSGFSVAAVRTRGVCFCNQGSYVRPVYRLAKVAGEMLNIFAAGLDKGHDMAVYLRRNANNANALITRCPNGCQSPLRDTDILQPEGVLRCCPDCGQIVSQCSAEQYKKSNLEWDTDSGTWPRGKDFARLSKRRARTIKTLSRILRKNYSAISLLDVGCSSGAFLQIANSLGVHAEGVEPTEKPVVYARELGLKVHLGLLEEINFPDNSFDAITLYEVIEHLDAPAKLFEECRRILRPGGVLVIGTGNTDSWTRKVKGAAWDFFDIHLHGGHINFFSHKSIATLASYTGFKVAKIKTSGVKFFEQGEVSFLIFKISKIFAELLNAPSMLLNKGHQMEVYMVSTKLSDNG